MKPYRYSRERKWPVDLRSAYWRRALLRTARAWAWIAMLVFVAALPLGWKTAAVIGLVTWPVGVLLANTVLASWVETGSRKQARRIVARIHAKDAAQAETQASSEAIRRDDIAP